MLNIFTDCFKFSSLCTSMGERNWGGFGFRIYTDISRDGMTITVHNNIKVMGEVIP